MAEELEDQFNNVDKVLSPEENISAITSGSVVTNLSDITNGTSTTTASSVDTVQETTSSGDGTSTGVPTAEIGPNLAPSSMPPPSTTSIGEHQPVDFIKVIEGAKSAKQNKQVQGTKETSRHDTPALVLDTTETAAVVAVSSSSLDTSLSQHSTSIPKNLMEPVSKLGKQMNGAIVSRASSASLANSLSPSSSPDFGSAVSAGTSVGF